ncbi:MAG: ASKHA domain-containing protein [Candidatus Omnitrophica bacterium]|nr:ASKHA domain-containing protein [Candidatus Omnitrophota bacterium]
MRKFKVTFYPDNKTVEVEGEKTILSAAISAGIYINAVCGGDGVCGRCKVILKKGKVATQPTRHITAEERKHNVYLACLTEIQDDLEVEIPIESRLNLEGLTQEEVNKRMAKDYSTPEDIQQVEQKVSQGFRYFPLTRKIFLDLPRPTLNDNLSDLERIEREIEREFGITVQHTGLTNIRTLGEILRSSDWKVTVVLGGAGVSPEILFIESGDTSERNFGVVFDIGTTTVTGQLLNLNTRQILGTKATYNKQAAFGSDVITRIIYAKDANGLIELHDAVTEDINEIILRLTDEHKVDLNDITMVVCSGNTTMMHLLLKVDPTHIRREPYVPAFSFTSILRASEVEIRINPRGLLFCVPGIASYLGGDVTAGILSCGIHKQEKLNMLIDIGTNGEIVLGNRDFLVACAASAGPAFEGSGVICGMRASRGAVQKVKISSGDLEPTYQVIGEIKPQGICGSGYIDILAEMLATGIIDRNGRIRQIEHHRIRNGEYGREFVVASNTDTATGSDVVVTDTDIDNLKRAKAAIYAACTILLKHMQLDFSVIEHIFIGGGFGTYLDIENAIRIGLIPDIDRNKFIFVGNSSLSGAREIILSEEAKRQADEIARRVTCLELSVEPGYMEEYMAALFFPHTDLTLFPNVKI